MSTLKQTRDELANQHALKMLGREQYELNKNAKKAIANDFKEGWNALAKIYNKAKLLPKLNP